MAYWIMMHEHPFTIYEDEGIFYMMKTAIFRYEKINRKATKDGYIIYMIEKRKR